MKIRNWFVSNSSTSSFICFGWNYELDNETEKLFLKEFYEYLDSIHYEYIYDHLGFIDEYIPDMFEADIEDDGYYLYFPLGGKIEETIDDLNYFKSYTINHTVLQKIKEKLGEPVIVSGEVYC